jgi:hypothetical protein
MIQPQFEIIIQCIDVVKALPTAKWQSLERHERRAAGLIARWAIEKAFNAAILANGAPIPRNRTLVNLAAASCVELLDEQRSFLVTVDREVTATEPEVADDLEVHLDCCYLARGIVQTIHQHLSLVDIMNRRNP